MIKSFSIIPKNDSSFFDIQKSIVLNPQMNVFVGENGFGKSYLMSLLCLNKDDDNHQMQRDKVKSIFKFEHVDFATIYDYLINKYFETETFGDSIFNILEYIFADLTGINGLNIKDIHYDKIIVHPETTNDDVVDDLNKVSKGTKYLITLFVEIYRFLEDLKDKNDVRKRECVIVIDDIDCNLHIKWQRNILYLLQDIFPNVQFIVTTQSPFIISGREEGQVFALKYYKDTKIVVKTYYDKDFTNDSITNIMLEVFGDVDCNKTKDRKLHTKFGVAINSNAIHLK